ncbi:Uncharacterised protein [Sphingobacterium multivorum]|uniref:Uncharacterized protein n=1 Tax=Sphingobacterium multivorum TaxID=28454 RepID=A0A2X2LFJ4_SPHMU|nr:Uncharacterised protein [Sphingobacterium multivorum]
MPAKILYREKIKNSLGEKHIQHITDIFTQFHDQAMETGIVEERFALYSQF